MRTMLLALFFAMSGTAIAEANETKSVDEIPTAERAFVDSISGVDKAKIVQQFGEPSKRDDIKTDTGRIVASIWHYHFLNTNEEGAYYETTELDFVDDKVVMVVFMNNNGEETPGNGVRQAVPPRPGMLPVEPSQAPREPEYQL